MDHSPERPSRTNFGFIAAGIMNIGGVLIFSRALTSDALGVEFPAVFGRFGLVAIILWGMAYLSVARRYRDVPALMAVFAIEKAVYVATWIWWLSTQGAQWPALWQHDPLTAIFFAIYGPNDLLFGVFFAWCWATRRR